MKRYVLALGLNEDGTWSIVVDYDGWSCISKLSISVIIRPALSIPPCTYPQAPLRYLRLLASTLLVFDITWEESVTKTQGA